MRLPWLVILGCGAASSGGALRGMPEPESLATAREDAPDLVVAGDRARARAEEALAAADDDAAEDHATRARLLYDAAVVEAERVAMERARLELEMEIEAQTVAAADAERARAEVDAERGRLRAAEVAEDQARMAFAQAERDEERRARRRRSETNVAHRQASNALFARARLVLAAARAMGADEAAVAEVQAQLEAERDPTESVAAADAAHRAALVLLGEARAAHPVTDEARASLRAAALERELEVEMLPTGLAVRGDVMVGRRVSPGRASALAQLVIAHPHGPVQVHGSARERRALIAALRAREVEAARLVEGDGSRLELVFVGYGPP